MLVDFWATWCGPCMMLAPIVEEIAEEYQGKVKIGKINVDEQGPLAMQFGIQSIPTLLYFKGGKLVDTKIGYCTKAQIEQMF